RSGSGRSTATTAERQSATAIGSRVPTRSDRRPTPTFITDSSPAAQRKTAPIATVPSPSAARRSGASTSSTPKRSAGKRTNQNAAATGGSTSAAPSSASGCGSAGRSAGIVDAQATRPSERTPTVVKVTPTPATPAIAPSTGPKSAPATAVANALPIAAPRRSTAVAARSQENAPVHENALAPPCRKRAVSSSQARSPRPKATVQTATIVRPTRTVRFAPARAATIPLGTAPTNAPAGYAPESTPAPVLPRPSSCA